jgi:hypothetical protein
MGYAVLSSTAVIPNLGYAYPQVYEPENLGVCGKKLNNGGKKGTLLGYLLRVTTHKFDITATILITNVLLI